MKKAHGREINDCWSREKTDGAANQNGAAEKEKKKKKESQVMRNMAVPRAGLCDRTSAYTIKWWLREPGAVPRRQPTVATTFY